MPTITESIILHRTSEMLVFITQDTCTSASQIVVHTWSDNGPISILVILEKLHIF